MTCGKNTTEVGRITRDFSLLLNMTGRKRMAGNRDIEVNYWRGLGKMPAVAPWRTRRKRRYCLPSVLCSNPINSDITDGRCNVL